MHLLHLLVVSSLLLPSSFFISAYFLPLSIQPSSSSSSPPPQFRPPSLSHAQSVAGVDDWVLEHYTNPNATHPNFEPLLNIRFPSLSKRQFRKLHKLYSQCGGPSHVRFHNHRTTTTPYDILDFLAPAIQATWGHRFQPEDEFGRAPLFYQCYGFLLDVLSLKHKQPFAEDSKKYQRLRFLRPSTWLWQRRQTPTAPRLTLSTPDSRAVFEALQRKSRLISKDFSPSNNYAKEDGIQPGDLVLIYHDNTKQYLEHEVWLDHLVMYVDEGLLLEKSGSGAGTTFRLVDYGTFDKTWGIGVFEMQVRRPKRSIDVVKDLTIGGMLSLPTINNLFRKGRLQDMPGNPNELCGSYDDDTEKVLYTRVIPTEQSLQFDEAGRASLPSSFFEPFLDQ